MQNLRIKSFYRSSRNVVYSPLCIAVAVYVLIAIIKKQLNSSYSQNKIVQIVSVGIFQKMSLNQVFTEIAVLENGTNSVNSKYYSIPMLDRSDLGP